MATYVLRLSSATPSTSHRVVVSEGSVYFFGALQNPRPNILALDVLEVLDAVVPPMLEELAALDGETVNQLRAAANVSEFALGQVDPAAALGGTSAIRNVPPGLRSLLLLRQTDRQTDGQRDRQANRQKDRQTEKQTHEHAHAGTHGASVLSSCCGNVTYPRFVQQDRATLPVQLMHL